MAAIREGIERYYWPSIIEGTIEVRFFNEDQELPQPDPEANPALKPYIEAYRRARSVLSGATLADRPGYWQGASVKIRSGWEPLP